MYRYPYGKAGHAVKAVPTNQTALLGKQAGKWSAKPAGIWGMAGNSVLGIRQLNLADASHDPISLKSFWATVGGSHS